MSIKNYWTSGQLVTAEQMTDFSSNTYFEIGAVVNSTSPCILSLNGDIIINGNQIFVPSGNFSFNTNTTITQLPYVPDSIIVNCPQTTLTIDTNGYVIAKYGVTPDTENNALYTFTGSYQFVNTYSSDQVMVCEIQNGSIMSLGYVFRPNTVNKMPMFSIANAFNNQTPIRLIAYNPQSKIWALGGNKLYYTMDGVNIFASPNNNLNLPSMLSCVNNIFIANVFKDGEGGVGYLYYSNNGIDWTQCNGNYTDYSTTQQPIYDMQNNFFVSIGSEVSPHQNQLIKSLDGVTWNKITTYTNPLTILRMLKQNSIFLAGTNNGMLLSVDNYVTFQQILNLPSKQIQSISYGNNQYLTCVSTSLSNVTFQVFKNSYSILDWDMVLDAQPNSQLYFANNLWQLYGSTTVMYSSDGISWYNSNMNLPSGKQVTGICYGNGVWMLTTNDSTNLNNFAYYSNDGEFWQPIMTPLHMHGHGTLSTLQPNVDIYYNTDLQTNFGVLTAKQQIAAPIGNIAFYANKKWLVGLNIGALYGVNVLID